MEEIYIKDDHIKLGQALKLCGAVGSGVEAKVYINEGLVKVNGEQCMQRGRKLFEGDTIEYRNSKYIISKA
ncbi:MAG: RNA-binding S4 domain-containing protein [Lachnospiraceae bacterium]|nr:RNA-binding S4 domain-containing protein [Lachnospiraceae bacterium]